MKNISAWINSEEILRLNIFLTLEYHLKDKWWKSRNNEENYNFKWVVFFFFENKLKGAEDTAINSWEEDAGGQWVWGQDGHKPRLCLS